MAQARQVHTYIYVYYVRSLLRHNAEPWWRRRDVPILQAQFLAHGVVPERDGRRRSKCPRIAWLISFKFLVARGKALVAWEPHNHLRVAVTMHMRTCESYERHLEASAPINPKSGVSIFTSTTEN